MEFIIDKSSIKQPDIHYRRLTEHELTPQLFARFNRYQEVTQCWRKENETWTLKNIAFTEHWDSKEINYLAECLQNTLRSGGVVLGAFKEKNIAGFASLENNFFGTKFRYLQLSSLHVTYEMRGSGIGKELFHEICAEAKKRNAEKLYISAHSSKETQAFYKAIGCNEAKEYNQQLMEKEPCDCQLEFNLANIKCE